jgi:LysM repeat protein
MRIVDKIFDRIVESSSHRAVRWAAFGVVPVALAASVTVTVHSGNNLSELAVQYCGSAHANDWTGIYETNKAVIGGNPNLIIPGQRLKIRCYDPSYLLSAAAPVQHSSNAGAPPTSTHQSSPTYAGSGPAQQVNPGDYSGFQACVISRESGGNSQVMNSSGHYGLYQFAAGTWAAYGGNPGDFGHASVSEQNQVFANAMAAGGESNWAPYDGC